MCVSLISNMPKLTPDVVASQARRRRTSPVACLMAVSPPELNALRESAIKELGMAAVPPVNPELMKSWSSEDAAKFFSSGGLFLPASCEPLGYKAPPSVWKMPASTSTIYVLDKESVATRVGIVLIDERKEGAIRTIVQQVVPGGLTAAAGIPIGATILSVNGTAVTGTLMATDMIKANSGRIEICVANS